MAWRGRPRPAALPGDGDAAPGHAAPLGRRQHRLRARPAPHPPARAPAADRGSAGAHRARRLRARTRARALLRRAAAPRAGALLGAQTAGALPRRAHRQSRPGGDPRDRGRDRGHGRRRDQDHHDHPRSRPGAPACGRGDVPAPRAPAGACRSARVLRRAPRTSSPAPSCAASCSGGSAASSPRPRPDTENAAA